MPIRQVVLTLYRLALLGTAVFCIAPRDGIAQKVTTVDVPDASRTIATGINNQGQVAGTFWAPGLGNQGFLLDRHTVTSFAVPRAIQTDAWGGSNRGQVAG
jgi:hypothetical protein